MQHWCIREIIYMFLVGHVSEFVEHCDFLRHHECNKCQTLYEGTKQWAYLFITLSVTLTLLQDHSSVSFNWKLHSLIWLSWNFVELLSTSSRSWIYHYFWFRTCSREIIDIFPRLQNFKTLPFIWTLLKQDLSNFAWL